MLTSPEFIQGLHDNIRQTLTEFTTQNNLPLKDMQKNIDFNTHSSTAVFSKIVENTRKYCMAESKKISEKKKKKKNRLFKNSSMHVIP